MHFFHVVIVGHGDERTYLVSQLEQALPRQLLICEVTSSLDVKTYSNQTHLLSFPHKIVIIHTDTVSQAISL